MSGGGSEDLWVPPGWYQDPYNGAFLRYWDGRAWTGRLVPAPGTVTSPSFHGGARGSSRPPDRGRLLGTALGAGALVLLVTVVGQAPSALTTRAAVSSTTAGAQTGTRTQDARAPHAGATRPNASRTPAALPPSGQPTTPAVVATPGSAPVVVEPPSPAPASPRPRSTGSAMPAPKPTRTAPAPPDATVPAVVSADVDDARAALEAAGFVVRVTTRKVKDGVEGAVIAQSPAASSTRPAGSVVRIVVAHVLVPTPSQTRTGQGPTPGRTRTPAAR